VFLASLNPKRPTIRLRVRLFGLVGKLFLYGAALVAAVWGPTPPPLSSRNDALSVNSTRPSRRRKRTAMIGLHMGDRDAVKAIMGHTQSDILAEYDEAARSDERRMRVVDHVRSWLFAPKS
jgi:hypothetical protein